jgi:diamine N-acetyltransferase
MTAPFAVRPTAYGDVDSVISLVKASWARTYDPVIGEVARIEISDAKHTPALFEREIAADDGLSLIATDRAGAIIGHIGGLVRPDGTCFVDRIHVVPHWQGRGVAAALLEQACTALNGEASALELTVLENNGRALAFYRKVGFREVAGATPKGLAHVPAILMRLDLPA